MVLEVQDINTLSNLVVLLSSLFLFYKWRIRNHRFALNFLVIGFVYFSLFIIELFDVTESTYFLLRAILSIIFTISLAYACTCILKESRHILAVFGLYVFVPVFLIFQNNITDIYFFIRVIGHIILIPFFMLLFTVRMKEIKIFSVLGVFAVTISMLFLGTLITNPQLREVVPWYITRVMFAAMFLILAHFSVHMHDGILNRRRRRRK